MNLQERNEVLAVARILRCPPSRIACAGGFDLDRIDRLLATRGQAPLHGESLFERLDRFYGEGTSKRICQALANPAADAQGLAKAEPVGCQASAKEEA